LKYVLPLPIEPDLGERIVRVLALAIAAYVVLAYVIAPALWRHYGAHPSLETAPKTTRGPGGVDGDPLNVGLIGTRDEVIRAMLVAAWLPADPITLRSSFKIAASVLLVHPYPDAPVSNLYLFDRRQDFAFEQSAGASARRRHHVRFWAAPQLGMQGRSFWLGAATFDRSVGVSHLTGQITHHIEADVDAERDKLLADLEAAGMLVRRYRVSGVGPTLGRRNGGGDRYFTDGELSVGVLAYDSAAQAEPPVTLASPLRVRLKDRLWARVRGLLKQVDDT
jgi:hypothetical protein